MEVIMITTFTGPMFSGKSTGLLNAYETIWNKTNIVAFKPKIYNLLHIAS